MNIIGANVPIIMSLIVGVDFTEGEEPENLEKNPQARERPTTTTLLT